jgi:hypothetical protein
MTEMIMIKMTNTNIGTVTEIEIGAVIEEVIEVAMIRTIGSMTEIIEDTPDADRAQDLVS